MRPGVPGLGHGLEPLLRSPRLGSKAKDRHQLRGKGYSPALHTAPGPHLSLAAPLTSRWLWSQPGVPCCRKGETWSLSCPYLSTIVARGTVGPAGTSRTWGTLHTTFTGETSLALGEKDGHVLVAPGAGPSTGHRWGQQRLYLLLLRRGQGHQGLQEHPEAEGGTDMSKGHRGPQP